MQLARREPSVRATGVRWTLGIGPVMAVATVALCAALAACSLSRLVRMGGGKGAHAPSLFDAKVAAATS